MSSNRRMKKQLPGNKVGEEMKNKPSFNNVAYTSDSKSVSPLDNIKTVYTVRACRWGSYETHSYIVGVFKTINEAKCIAEAEESYSGGKYSCEILKWKIGSVYGCGYKYEPEKIKNLTLQNWRKY